MRCFPMKVLVVHPTPRPFIELDINILRSVCTVRAVQIRFHPRRRFMVDTIAALRHVAWADVVLAWFGGLHALVPFAAARLLGKQCAVIASGVDVAAMPSIKYGHMRPGWLRAVGRLVFRMAHRVFAVSAFTANETMQNVGVPPDKMEIIPHGLPPAPRIHGSERRGVVTVATVDARAIRLKGLATFVQAATRLPGIPFEIIGGGEASALRTLRHQAPRNVAFTGWLPPKDLQRRMLHCTVYAQLSAYEAFGMALAEAMQCGCVPVVTRRGALPEVVGKAGWYVAYGDPEETADAIQQALAAPAAASVAARCRVETCFPLQRRREALTAALHTLVR